MSGSYEGLRSVVVEPDLTGRQPLVAIVGPGEDADTGCLAAAEETGFLLAEAGAVVVCGGLGGVMEAACRGAAAAGGLTIGLLPGRDRADANPYVTVALATGLGEMRNALLVRCADAVIGIGGSAGTLSEIALAQRTGVPVVWMHGWEIEPLDVATVDSPSAAVAWALEVSGGAAA
jgi:uncharacterized protein (TIGR00725 family)